MWLMPCFEIPNQANEEGQIVGLILVGYGELETTLLACLVASDYQVDSPIREIFQGMNAEVRIKKAKKLLLKDYTNAGLEKELREALSDLDFCRKMRNQYAHCQWGWDPRNGLMFVNLEQLAVQPTPIISIMKKPFYLNLALLKEQREFCVYVRQCFMYLSEAYKAWDRSKLGVSPSIPPAVKPSKRKRPRLHNLQP